MPKTIVAIGGGEIRTRGTAPIDREIIRLSQKKHPRLLFIPTASSDSERYWEHVQKYFGGFLQCSKPHSRAYRVYKSGGKVVVEQIRQEKQLAPIESLARRHGRA